MYFDHEHGIYYKFNDANKQFELWKRLNENILSQIKSNPQRYDIFDMKLVEISVEPVEQSSKHDALDTSCKSLTRFLF